MNRASSRSPTLPGFAFWVMVFWVCAGLRWGSPGLVLAAMIAAPLLLLAWLLARV